MAYNVSFKKRADKDLEAILKSVSPAMRQNLLDTIERLRENPYPRQNLGAGQDVVKRLRNVRKPGNGDWRIECGVYRLRYDIEGSNVEIARVGHRSEIYDDI